MGGMFNRKLLHFEVKRDKFQHNLNLCNINYSSALDTGSIVNYSISAYYSQAKKIPDLLGKLIDDGTTLFATLSRYKFLLHTDPPNLSITRIVHGCSREFIFDTILFKLAKKANIVTFKQLLDDSKTLEEQFLNALKISLDSEERKKIKLFRTHKASVKFDQQLSVKIGTAIHEHLEYILTLATISHQSIQIKPEYEVSIPLDEKGQITLIGRADLLITDLKEHKSTLYEFKSTNIIHPLTKQQASPRYRTVIDIPKTLDEIYSGSSNDNFARVNPYSGALPLTYVKQLNILTYILDKQLPDNAVLESVKLVFFTDIGLKLLDIDLQVLRELYYYIEQILNHWASNIKQYKESNIIPSIDQTIKAKSCAKCKYKYICSNAANNISVEIM